MISSIFAGPQALGNNFGIRVENDPPGAIVVLLLSDFRVLADSNVEASSRFTPKHIDEVRGIENRGHEVNETFCGSIE
jgi:hypothetical protein